MKSRLPSRNGLLRTVAAVCLLACAHVPAGESPRILCTTFPIHQITRNIVEGRAGVAVDLMIPAAMGCPHDYALTPQDMAKIAAADILIVNGLGMEEFLGKPVERANPGIIVVDSSLDVRDAIIRDEHDDGDGDEDDRHHHDDVNPHLFTSPSLAARLAETIAARLGMLDPDGAAVYSRNAAAYAETLRALARDMAEAGKRFANNRIVEPHGAFDYLARDLNLDIVAHLQPHGQELSASRMLELLAVVRKTKPAAIVVEPLYPSKAGETLAAETGLPLLRLDPAAGGPDDAPLDYYESVMRRNLATLRIALGGQ